MSERGPGNLPAPNAAPLTPLDEAWRELIATALRRNVVVAVGEHRAAIEAEARADFWRDFDRYAFSHPEVPYNDLKASMEWLEATLRKRLLGDPRFRAAVDEVFAAPGEFGPAKGYYGFDTGHFIDMLLAALK